MTFAKRLRRRYGEWRVEAAISWRVPRENATAKLDLSDALFRFPSLASASCLNILSLRRCY